MIKSSNCAFSSSFKASDISWIPNTKLASLVSIP
ncbi:hypothetical protein [Chryseobacterium sp. LC2016-29]